MAMLVYMAEVYLRVENESEPEKGVKVMGQLFKDDGKPVRLESIEKEVKRLISDPVANHNQKHPATSPRKVVLSVISYIKGCFSFGYYSTSNVVFFSYLHITKVGFCLFVHLLCTSNVVILVTSFSQI